MPENGCSDGNNKGVSTSDQFTDKGWLEKKTLFTALILIPGRIRTSHLRNNTKSIAIAS